THTGITGAACAIGEQPIKALIVSFLACLLMYRTHLTPSSLPFSLSSPPLLPTGPHQPSSHGTHGFIAFIACMPSSTPAVCEALNALLSPCSPLPHPSAAHRASSTQQPWRAWQLGRPSPTLSMALMAIGEALTNLVPRNHASTAAMAQMAVGRSLSNLVWAKVGWCGMGCCNSQLIPAGSRIQMYAVKMGAAGATMTRITVEIVSSSGNNYCRSHEHVSSLLEATSCIPIPAF
ncbi:unnamed protein product, partial [Closterium sp. NIES-54]